MILIALFFVSAIQPFSFAYSYLYTAKTLSDAITNFKARTNSGGWVGTWEVTSSSTLNCQMQSQSCCFTDTVKICNSGANFLLINGNAIGSKCSYLTSNPSVPSGTLQIYLYGTTNSPVSFDIGSDITINQGGGMGLSGGPYSEVEIDGSQNQPPFYGIRLPSLPSNMAQSTSQFMNFLYLKVQTSESACPCDCPSNCCICSSSTSCISCISNYFVNSSKGCSQCIINCNTCTSSTCLTCNDGYVLINQQCVIPTPTTSQPNQPQPSQPQSQPKSKESDEHFQKYDQSIGTSLIGSSAIISFASNIQSPDCKMALQLIGIQKVQFFLLVNILKTDSLYSFFDELSAQAPVNSFQSLNLFVYSSLLKQENTISENFKKQKISSSIFMVSGGGCFIFFIILGISWISFLLLKISKTSKITSLIYSKIISGQIVQLSQMVVLLSSFGVAMQLVEFINFPDYPNKIEKIIMFFVNCIIILSIIFVQINEINPFLQTQITDYRPKYLFDNPVEFAAKEFMQSIIQEKILNGCIKESRNCRLFVLCMFWLDTIVFPFIIVFLRNNFRIQLFLMIGFQTLMFIMSAYLRPFTQKLDNLFTIIDQFLWVVITCVFSSFAFIIENYTDEVQQGKLKDNQNQQLNSLSSTLIILIFITLFWNPLISILKIAVVVFESIKSKKNQSSKSNNLVTQNIGLTEIQMGQSFGHQKKVSTEASMRTSFIKEKKNIVRKDKSVF